MAEAVIKLPYVIEPQQQTTVVGHKGCGAVELPKYFALQDNEIQFINEHELSIQTLAVETARAILKLKKQPGENEENTILNTANALLFRNFSFFSESKEAMDLVLEFDKQRKLLYRENELIEVTAIIKCRLISSWELANTKDSTKLHPGLLSALIKFAEKEKEGALDPEIEVKPEDTVAAK